MPVRSLTSSVLRWPDGHTVEQAVRAWADRTARGGRGGVRRIGYFGSYARGDWGVGSDLDLIVIVDHSIEARERRSLDWDMSDLPVPADVLIYTVDEWKDLSAANGRFATTLRTETIWIL